MQAPASKAVLSGSKNCGLWELTPDANGAAQDQDALIQGRKETRAGQYSRDCYGPQLAPSFDQCNLFKERSIPTAEMDMEQQCPFVNETYCQGNGYTAVRFTTGLVDASQIGINAPSAPQFNRTMMCVPLNMVYPSFYIEKIDETDGHFGYNLGPVESD
jgi:hypothetical protein